MCGKSVEDKSPGILSKLRLLVDNGLVEELKPDFAYRITPRLAKYLKNRQDSGKSSGKKPTSDSSSA